MNFLEVALLAAFVLASAVLVLQIVAAVNSRNSRRQSEQALAGINVRLDEQGRRSGFASG